MGTFKYWQKGHSCGSDWWTNFSGVLSPCCGNAHGKHQTQDKSSSKDTQLKSIYWLFRWKKCTSCVCTHTSRSCVSMCMWEDQEQLKQLSCSAGPTGRSWLRVVLIIPSLVACLVPAAEWSFLYSKEATAAKMGLPLPSLPVRKRVGAGGVYALFSHKTLSFESWHLAWLLLSSSLLGTTVLQSEQTLVFACWRFCLWVCVVRHGEALAVFATGERCTQRLSHLPYPRYLVLVYHD